MPKNSLRLPIILILVITALTAIAIFSGRSNQADVAGDSAYPHHVCTFNRYCAGESCTDAKVSFVAYLFHADGFPRVEMVGLSPRARLSEDEEGLIFESSGGEVSGTLRIFKNRGLDFVGSSGVGEELIEHYGSGSCDRLVGG